MAAAGLPVRRGDSVAVGAGSRGIANIDSLVKAVIDHLKGLGARPFIFPAMGSHGGATPDGQRDVLAHYGITEATMGCEVRATRMVQVGGARCRYGSTASHPRRTDGSSTASPHTVHAHDRVGSSR
jgi:hypothetical protein